MRIRREKLRATEAFDDEAGGHGPAPVGLGIDLERAFEHLSETSRAGGVAARRGGLHARGDRGADGEAVSFSKSQLARAHARLRKLLEEGSQTR